MTRKFELLVGTTAGNTEFLASELEAELQTKGFLTHFQDVPEFKQTALNAIWLLCVATHGAGEYAESIQAFIEDITQEQPQLDGIQYAVVAVGDSSYDTFCQAGKDVDALLQSLGARPITDMLMIDMMLNAEPEKTAKLWLSRWIEQI
ncbi:MAG: flavodoxin MioC [Idiomarinaceae bacterium HL-53]|nr:MAG: flavodoxin MioC [Idiomarinaceae bacterium HL-53]CUS47823.1 MioC protein [Idiomarinaceae bacterium HL-53]